MLEIVLGVSLFTMIIIALVFLILGARSQLVATGNVSISINEKKSIQSPAGRKLLHALAGAQFLVPSPCGGRGTCGQCRVKVLEGGGAILPSETSHITKREAAEGQRLSCQVVIKQNLNINVPEDVFGIKKWECTVASNRNVATFIKEFKVDLPPEETMDFRAGGYIQIECPPHNIKFKDFEIDQPFRGEWDHHNLWRHESIVKEPLTRAYSMANYPDEKGYLMLNVRLATPPNNASETVPPGKMSSYIFSRKPGHRVSVSGPFGEFFAKETSNEMVFVGGGAGMAPMRSHIFDQLKRLRTDRKITFWYGARSRKEMFYVEDFDQLQTDHHNFQWFVALSQPSPEDQWTGFAGYIHSVLYENYLKDHSAPEDCEYYLCGPPMMTEAVITMLEDLGVERDHILLDDFGG